MLRFEARSNGLAARFRGEDLQEFLAYVKTAVEVNRAAFKRFFGTLRWRSPAFEFARQLKAHPQLEKLSAEAAADIATLALESISEQEEEAGFKWESLIGHTDTEGEQVDPFSDFIICWDKVQPAGRGGLAVIVQQAEATGRPADYFGRQFQGNPWAKFRGFLAVCEELQAGQGQESIVLAEEPLATALGTSAFQVSRWRQMGERYGFLTKTKEHTRGRAAEFTFQMPDQRPHPSTHRRGV